MKKRKLNKKQKIFILSVCCLVFIFSVIGIFSLFQHRLSEEYNIILTDGLTADIEEQKKNSELIISNLHGTLELLQDTLESSSANVPEDGWEVEIQESKVKIDYLKAQEFLKLTDSFKLQKINNRLKLGEEVVTELGEQGLTDEDSQFALLQPVLRDGNLAGVLRARMDIQLLMGTSVTSDSFFQKVYIILTRPDGSIVYANTPYPNRKNFLSATLQGGIDSEKVEAIQQVFEKNEKKTISFLGKGNKYYMSWETFDFNDWRVVMFARSPDVVLQTTTILRGMIIGGVGLIVLTVIFCMVFIHFLLRQKHLLDMQQRRYDALAQFNDTLLFEYDIVSNRVVLTPNALERLDLDERHLEGIPGEYYVQNLIHPDDREHIREKFDFSNIILGETYYMEIRSRCKDGKYNWFGCQFKSIEDREEGASRIVGKLVDISDQRGREQVLQQAALKDILTGVYNRSAEMLINNLLKKDEQGLFFMLDLDDFKNVNDTYGHAVGDALLIDVSRILKEAFRPDDIIARVGGDEFVVFISGTNDSKIAQNKAAIIQSRMEQLCISGTGQSVSASIGAASAPQDGITYHEIASAADQAMYTIKQKSKKGFSLYNADDL